MIYDSPPQTILDVVADFLANNPTPDEIVAYQLPSILQERAHDLLERNAQDVLTEEEREEMNDFVRIEQMMSLIKIKTRLKLKRIAE
jgi:hypothetical protein